MGQDCIEVAAYALTHVEATGAVVCWCERHPDLASLGVSAFCTNVNMLLCDADRMLDVVSQLSGVKCGWHSSGMWLFSVELSAFRWESRGSQLLQNWQCDDGTSACLARAFAKVQLALAKLAQKERDQVKYERKKARTQRIGQ
jgi:hypothetical protein